MGGRHRAGAGIHTRHPPELGQLLEHPAGATTGVEDAGAVRQVQPRHLLANQSKATSVPPMPLLVVKDGLELTFSTLRRLATRALAGYLVLLDFR